MHGGIESALIGVAGAIILAACSYWFTKQRERESEQRKEKLAYYKAFVAALSGVMENEDTLDGQRAFAKACNDLHLFAPVPVIDAPHFFQDEIRISNRNKSKEQHDQLLTKLVTEMRRDMGIKSMNEFSVKLQSAGLRSFQNSGEQAP